MRLIFLFLMSFSAFAQSETWTATLNSRVLGRYNLRLHVSLPHNRDLKIVEKTYIYLDDQRPQWACSIEAQSIESIEWEAIVGGHLFSGQSQLYYSVSEDLESEFHPCSLSFQSGFHLVSLSKVPQMRIEIEKGLFLTISLYSGLWRGRAELTNTSFDLEIDTLRTESRRIRNYDLNFSVTRQSGSSTSFLEHGVAHFNE